MVGEIAFADNYIPGRLNISQVIEGDGGLSNHSAGTVLSGGSGNVYINVRPALIYTPPPDLGGGG